MKTTGTSPDWHRRDCDRTTKPFEVDVWQRWPGCGIGIAAGAVVGIDIDVLDAALSIKLAALAVEMLCDTPCWRIGRAPKRLLVYRATVPFAGRKRHPLELLARGQQFVAYAVHPDTGQPYAWPEANLLDVPLDRLPAVDEAACHAFLDAAWALIPEELRGKSILAHAPSDTWRGSSDPKGTVTRHSRYRRGQGEEYRPYFVAALAEAAGGRITSGVTPLGGSLARIIHDAPS
jgi:hypothetical protein